MIRVPITIGFDLGSTPIGFAEIDETKLPPYPMFHFALAYLVDDITNQIGYKIIQLGLIPDAKFRSYET